tara:strand:+ start:268 stop:678 length:411 start_codon:yes stop_codon:yes gene_type:complete
LEKNSNSPDITMSIGFEFSQEIKAGDIIAIEGEIGAGKTTFIKGILKGLGYKGNVNSPTYTLINEYQADSKIIHIDCYREKNINRWIDIGFIDYLNDNNIIIIEWPEYIRKILPSDTIDIYIKHIEESIREIKILR